ncbi:hypothetical protein [Actinospongicola halichondriae]|uniref:hypothetical protein n=1 Tax=Actinospongicola halichondriae TaxID=3236844 RepID=UPI003D5B5662
MSLTERERHDAYEALQTAFGDSTDSVIRLIRTDHENLVTKDDLTLTTSVLRTEIADLRTELKTEMADLRTELKTEMADLRTEMAGLRVQFSNDINAAFAVQTRTMTIGLVASVILIALTNTLTVLLG